MVCIFCENMPLCGEHLNGTLFTKRQFARMSKGQFKRNGPLVYFDTPVEWIRDTWGDVNTPRRRGETIRNLATKLNNVLSTNGNMLPWLQRVLTDSIASEDEFIDKVRDSLVPDLKEATNKTPEEIKDAFLYQLFLLLVLGGKGQEQDLPWSAEIRHHVVDVSVPMPGLCNASMTGLWLRSSVSRDLPDVSFIRRGLFYQRTHTRAPKELPWPDAPSLRQERYSRELRPSPLNARRVDGRTILRSDRQAYRYIGANEHQTITLHSQVGAANMINVRGALAAMVGTFPPPGSKITPNKQLAVVFTFTPHAFVEQAMSILQKIEPEEKWGTLQEQEVLIQLLIFVAGTHTWYPGQIHPDKTVHGLSFGDPRCASFVGFTTTDKDAHAGTYTDLKDAQVKNLLNMCFNSVKSGDAETPIDFTDNQTVATLLMANSFAALALTRAEDMIEVHDKFYIPAQTFQRIERAMGSADIPTLMGLVGDALNTQTDEWRGFSQQLFVYCADQYDSLKATALDIVQKYTAEIARVELEVTAEEHEFLTRLAAVVTPLSRSSVPRLIFELVRGLWQSGPDNEENLPHDVVSQYLYNIASELDNEEKERVADYSAAYNNNSELRKLVNDRIENYALCKFQQFRRTTTIKQWCSKVAQNERVSHEIVMRHVVGCANKIMTISLTRIS